MSLDNLDRAIIEALSVGVCSYEDLAKQCGVTRNTVYRRIMLLEEKGVITNRLSCVLNFGKLGISVVLVSLKVPETDVKSVVSALVAFEFVKFVWRAYGEFSVVFVAFSVKGFEGEMISELRQKLEELGIVSFNFSVGYEWEKENYSPF